MSYFSGCSHDSSVIIVDVMLLLLLLLCSFGTSHQASLGGVGHDDYNHHHLNLFGSSSSSRDEVVQMAGYGEEKLSTVLITGSLSCQLAPARRFHNNIIIGDHHHHHQSHAWPISGALVGVNCHGYEQERKGSKSLVAEGVTDEFGDFMVDLPSHLHAIPNLEKICRVNVHGIPKGSLCRPPAAQRDVKGGGGGGLININLSSVGNGIRTYDAGNIRILHHSTSEPPVVVVLHRPPPPKYGGRRHL